MKEERRRKKKEGRRKKEVRSYGDWEQGKQRTSRTNPAMLVSSADIRVYCDPPQGGSATLTQDAGIRGV